MSTERIVLFRPGALGDALLAFPALTLLRRARPEAHVTFIARGDVLPLARMNGLADAAYSYDLPAWSALFAPQDASFAWPRGTEVPAHVTGGLKSAEGARQVNLGRFDPLAVGVLAGADVVAWLPDTDGVAKANLRALGAHRTVAASGRPDPNQTAHMALKLAGALYPLGGDVPGSLASLRPLLAPLRTSDDDRRRTETILAALGLGMANRVVALHPGSGGAVKRWPPESFAALGGILSSWGLRPLLIEGPQDTEVCAAVSAAASSPLPVARDLPLTVLSALLGRCAGYVGNDSGDSHLAGLMGTPTLALFGPTDPAIWAPLGPRVRTLRSPSGEMRELAIHTVADALHELLEYTR
jgi:heptosyltransferase-2